MDDTKQLLREVMYHHQWDDVGQWCDCLGALAKLSDKEIEELANSTGKENN